MRPSLIAGALALALTACGGGGSDSTTTASGGGGSNTGGSSTGGSTGGTGSGGNSTGVVITSANYLTVAQEVMGSAFYVTDASSLVTGAEVAQPSSLLQFSVAQALRAPARFAQAPVLASGALITLTENCPGGGTLTVKIEDIAGNTRLDTGDTISLTAVNCNADGETLNGLMHIVFDQVVGDGFGATYSATATITLANLSAATAVGTTSGSGTISLGIDSRSVNSLTTAIRTESLATTATYGGATVTRTLTGFTASTVTSPTPAPYTVSTLSNGTLVSSALSSRPAVLATTVPFLRNGAESYPAVGQATITGAANSKVRVTAQSATTVLVEVDADGNGAYEASTTRAWSQLF